MVDRLKQVGMMHDAVERLKITVNTGASWSAQALTTRLVIPSGLTPFLGFPAWVRTSVMFCHHECALLAARWLGFLDCGVEVHIEDVQFIRQGSAYVHNGWEFWFVVCHGLKSLPLSPGTPLLCCNSSCLSYWVFFFFNCSACSSMFLVASPML